MGRPLGQHFLTSRTVLAKIVAAAELTERDTVLEIGPGKGVLTRALAAAAGRVIAVEKDAALAAVLRKEFVGSPTVEIVATDIRDFLRSNVKSQMSNVRYKVVANIPYYLTSRLIRLLLEHKPQPELIVLMVQREVAERITAQPPKMNLLGLSVQFYGEPEIIARVPPSAFQPPPKVESAVIRIRPYKARSVPALFTKRFFGIARAGFAQRRKTLLNNLASGLKKPKTEVEAFFKAVRVDPGRRAETLTLKDWLRLVTTFTAKNPAD